MNNTQENVSCKSRNENDYEITADQKQEDKDEDVISHYQIHNAPMDAPLGRMQLLTCFCFLLVSLLLRDNDDHGLKVAAMGCAISTFLTIYYKLKLRPTSTYLLCGLSVVLNSIAFGHMLSPMMATGVSSVVAAIQAFMSLPFSITAPTKQRT